MQIVQAHQKLPDDDRNVFFRDQSRLHQISATAPRAKFHDNPQIRAFEEGAMVFRNIWGLEFRQDGYLLYNVFDFIFRVLNVDDLYGYRLSSPSIDTAK